MEVARKLEREFVGWRRPNVRTVAGRRLLRDLGKEGLDRVKLNLGSLLPAFGLCMAAHKAG